MSQMKPMRIRHGLHRSESMSQPSQLQRPGTAEVLPQKPSEVNPRSKMPKHHRNYSISALKLSDIQEVNSQCDITTSQVLDPQRSRLQTKSPFPEKRIRTPENRQKLNRSLSHLRKSNQSFEKPSTESICDLTQSISKEKPVVEKRSLDLRLPVISLLSAEGKNQKKPSQGNFRRFLENTFASKEVSQRNNKPVLQRGLTTVNTSTEPDLQEKNFLKNIFATTSDLTQNGNEKTKKRSKAFELREPIQIARASESTEEDNFLELIRSINKHQSPPKREKDIEKVVILTEPDAETLGSYHETEQHSVLEVSQEDKQKIISLRKQRRENAKNQTLPVLEKKRLTYMKFVIPIQEVDENTRRSEIESASTKESEMRKITSPSTVGKTESFVDVLEKMLSSNRRTLNTME